MMDHQEILKLTQGSPILRAGGHLTLPQAFAASGISTTQLLRASAHGKLSLYFRAGGIDGYLLPLESLPLNNPILGRAGGRIVPDEKHMPQSAAQHLAQGMLRVPEEDLPGVTAALLSSGDEIALLAFDLTDQPGMVFVPNEIVRGMRPVNPC